MGISTSVPGAEPRARAHRGREYLRRPAAEPRLRLRSTGRASIAPASELLRELELDIDPRRLVGDIPTRAPADGRDREGPLRRPQGPHPGRAHCHRDRERESKALFDLLRRLREGGLAIIYISHRLAEIFQIADRVSVLKDGALMGTEDVAKVDEKWIIKRMVGRDLYVTRSPGASAGEDHPRGRGGSPTAGDSAISAST